MRTTLSLLFLVFFIAFSFGQDLNSNDSSIKKLDGKIPKLMQEKHVPGMAFAVFENGKVIFSKSYGLSDIKENKNITSSTGFNIGSVSKIFTAIAIMKLVEEGKINLDAPVEKYLSRWKLPDSEFNKNKVTIRHLLSHTAGISVHGYPGFTNKSLLPTLEASLNGNNGPARADEKVEIIIEPQTQFKYSGGGYTILQLVIEEITKISFEKFMDKHIFKPLQMHNTSFLINKNIVENSAIPYDKNKTELPLEYFTAKGAAGLHTTLDDIILFVQDLFHKKSIISKKTFNNMIAPTLVSEGKYGLGFRILKFGPLEFKGHAGSNTGWESAFFFDFKTNSGLIMLTNGDEGTSVLKRILKTWASLKYKK